jgi:hypothetical protein
MIVEPFNRPICPTFQPGNILDKFLQFFTDELIEEIVVETIRYGNECLKDKNVSWETNLGEIKAFFGMTIIMGFVCLPKLYDYWSTNIQLHAFSIANKISRKLFCVLLIMIVFHLEDNQDMIKLAKLDLSLLLIMINF